MLRVAENISTPKPNTTPEDIPPETTSTIPWIKDGVKVPIILPSTDNQPKQGILKLTNNEWSFLPGRRNINPPIPLPNFLENAQSLINNKKLFQSWISRQRALTAQSVKEIYTISNCQS